MMGRGFQEAVRALPRINYTAIAVIIFVTQGLAAPPFAGPSPCAAPPCHYAVAMYLVSFAAPAVLCSFLLTSVVKLHLVEAAGTLPQKAGGRTKATLRLLFVLALGFSAASAGCGLAACSYALEIQCGRLACMAAADRAGLYAAHAVGGAVWAWVYGNFAKDAIFSD